MHVSSLEMQSWLHQAPLREVNEFLSSLCPGFSDDCQVFDISVRSLVEFLFEAHTNLQIAQRKVQHGCSDFSCEICQPSR
jgi:hypothetical protein